MAKTIRIRVECRVALGGKVCYYAVKSMTNAAEVQPEIAGVAPVKVGCMIDCKHIDAIARDPRWELTIDQGN